ncbi:hypothetical protein Gferi_19130 [Geosporobacter ferrireducens]|uniref:HTH gntR-type domain-containing protein n=1 Tax=Geosporobacter ferrireducens TaxID=1424294 RepID=A0A1D8GQI9_9FIRM|nr:hypothetical protein Gferi_19130 [Geosporobacter ferrireducens]
MSLLNHAKGAPPLYYQIKEFIKEKIENDEYSSGDTIPTEIELQKMFGVSRITVRQAINDLVNEGYVCKMRGKGTVVASSKIEEPLNRIMSYTEEMKLRGFNPVTKLVKVSIVKANKFIANHLELSSKDEVYKIERLRCADDSPMVFFTTYLSKELSLPLDESEYMGSLYELLKKNNNIEVVGAKEYFEAAAADEQVSSLLEVGLYAPVLKRTRISYDMNGKVIEYSICYYRADKYKYSVEIGSTP